MRPGKQPQLSNYDGADGYLHFQLYIFVLLFFFFIHGEEKDRCTP